MDTDSNIKDEIDFMLKMEQYKPAKFLLRKESV